MLIGRLTEPPARLVIRVTPFLSYPPTTRAPRRAQIQRSHGDHADCLVPTPRTHAAVSPRGAPCHILPSPPAARLPVHFSPRPPHPPPRRRVQGHREQQRAGPRARARAYCRSGRRIGGRRGGVNRGQEPGGGGGGAEGGAAGAEGGGGRRGWGPRRVVGRRAAGDVRDRVAGAREGGGHHWCGARRHRWFHRRAALSQRAPRRALRPRLRRPRPPGFLLRLMRPRQSFHLRNTRVAP
jgi:hypothetical protein